MKMCIVPTPRKIFLILFFILFILPSTVSAEKEKPLKMSESINHYFRFFQVEHYMRYECVLASSVCKITCNEAGANILARTSVKQAYFAERKRKLDGDVAGYLVVIENGYIWVSLPRNSACVFEGMTPKHASR